MIGTFRWRHDPRSAGERRDLATLQMAQHAIRAEMYVKCVHAKCVCTGMLCKSVSLHVTEAVLLRSLVKPTQLLSLNQRNYTMLFLRI